MSGRPAWISTDSICEQAREMASRGLTVSQISDCLGISPNRTPNHYDSLGHC